ncbi:Rrf2 family transcriptional regulator [Tropicimonas sp. IMCC6043]|uniref:Rrf2 family transcriptional regulator n=1 Tax=Tropicimonas sp. IMCC6043 TaxID=2510645 RepID=UPI00101BC0F8|nr:Rrf2 family transcriptional regulator [Tropicimonas sp. IMCC6043]RYH12098.1 Rrf2 family transcriptional regulator [Tropicimonas sp. IMCC6043]
MRLTVRTNLAMRALMFCAINSDRIVRKAEIAEACNSSENHLGVVINMLGQTGFIETARGRNGGIRLKVAPEALSVGQVFRVFEANVPFAECFAGSDNHCPLTASCRLRGQLSVALEAFYAALDKVTLADLIQDNSGLRTLLEIKPT